ncbi:toxic anion resistance protein [Microbacterium sp. 77mftsu3.1]|uniref:toxic anion resistance protein n=1 Tax=Microbacterium sp. 77mftsu3.1 TaxID=1761802 RepID=UPI000368B882|nr:toxic anion resistance protein [Microbacterium sp. 77mftsu3.1]SDH48986.1 Uncharacterized conserved protein YaaN involved in tellurite resistance [Microbacterium sp. 77mftsu3.1]
MTTPASPSQSLSLFIEKVPESREVVLSSQAQGFASDIVQYHPHSAEFAQRANDVRALASKEVVAANAGSSRLLERTVAQANRSGGDTTKKVANNLADLRTIVGDLTPNGADKNPFQKVLAALPGGKKIGRWLQRYESQKDQIDAIVKSLEQGKLELQKDNAALQVEQQNLRENMSRLQEYILFADQLDAAVAAEVERLRAAGDTERATALEQEIHFEIRQKAQNLRIQLAAADQGYLSMDLTRKNNIELGKGVDDTLSVTISAMRTAVMVATALENQAQVLESIHATRHTTEQAMLRNSQMLRQQGAAIQQQAAAPVISLEVLHESFANIRAAIDDVETFRAQAIVEMAENNAKLDAQLEEVRPFVERAAAIEQARGGDQAAITR